MLFLILFYFFPSYLNIFATVFSKMFLPLQACAQGYSKEMSSRMVLLAVYIELQSGEHFSQKAQMSSSLFEDRKCSHSFRPRNFTRLYSMQVFEDLSVLTLFRILSVSHHIISKTKCESSCQAKQCMFPVCRSLYKQCVSL